MTSDEPREGVVAAAESQRVRNELLRTPGSGVCPYLSCSVITQGGITGERRHQEVVHGIYYQEDR